LVIAVMTFSKDIVINLVKAANLGIFENKWIYAMIPPQLPENPNRCSHNSIKRSGNRHGRYAQCLQCLRRFRWNQEAGQWEFNPLQESSRSSPLPAPSSSNTRPTVAVPKAKTMTAGKGRSKGPMSRTATPLTSAPAHPLISPELYDLNQDVDFNMDTYPEENMSMAQAIYDSSPIYLPENRDELEEIIRQGQEAARRLELQEEEVYDESYDWETPEG
jgi:hypothetical protein